MFDLDYELIRGTTVGISLTLGLVLSLLVYFAPLPTFIRICRVKSTLLFDPLPYVVAQFSAMVFMYYTFIKTHITVDLLLPLTGIGCVVETIYIFIFLHMAHNKVRIFKKKNFFKALGCIQDDTIKLVLILNVGVLLIIWIFTLFLLEGETRVVVVGWICVASSVCAFGAPLCTVFQVVRINSSENMPFPLSICLTLSAFVWFVFGILMENLHIVLPNFFGFILGMLQILIYRMYKKPNKGIVEENKISQHLIKIVNLRKSEIHPIDDEVVYVEDGNTNKKMGEVKPIQECKANVGI